MFVGAFLLRWVLRIKQIKPNTLLDATLIIVAWAFCASIIIDNEWMRLVIAFLAITQMVRFAVSVVVVEVPGEDRADTISRAYYLIDLALAMVADNPKEAQLIRAFLNASDDDRLQFLNSLDRLTSGVSSREHQQ